MTSPGVAAGRRHCEGLLGRAAAELEGQAAGDTRALDGALELVRRLDGGDELALLGTAWPWRSGTGSSCAPCWTRGRSPAAGMPALVCSAGTLQGVRPPPA
ncbi:MAG: hypothetical protein ACLRWQ_11735 [Flavonifractor plautii]